PCPALRRVADYFDFAPAPPKVIAPPATRRAATVANRTFRPRICLNTDMKSTQEITRDVQELGLWIPALREQVSHVVVGQKYLVDRLLLGLLANGHILL